MHIITSPALPYWGHIPEGGLHPGSVIQITGHIPHHCSKFELNLFGGHEFGHHAEKHSNIGLQVRTKLNKRKVIVNSRHYGDWGHKEKHRDFHHLYHGCTFDVSIHVEHQHYRVMVNGHTICHYHHRVPLHEIRILNVEGHVDIHRIEFRHSHMSHGTHYNPSVPVVYPSAPSAPYYPPPVHGAAYPGHSTYPTTVYPVAPPPVVIQPVQPAYTPSTVIIEDHHHHQNPISGIIDSVFGHHHDHHHHDHHHHGHKHHHHHGHHY